jgi:hypothetical protein
MLDSAARLVDDPRPNGPIAVGRPELLGGVDLPGLMGDVGLGRRCAGMLTRRGQCRPDEAKLAEQRPRGGPRRPGPLFGLRAPDQPRAPDWALSSLIRSGSADLVRVGAARACSGRSSGVVPSSMPSAVRPSWPPSDRAGSRSEP